MSSAPALALPPGQALTGKFPVVGELSPASGLTAERWTVEITGRIERPQTVSLPQLLALPQQRRTVDIHCVTGWSRPAMTIEGVPLSVLLARVGVLSDARYVRFVAHSARAHDTSLPLALALEDTWLVHRIDGSTLDSEHGGPLRTVTPARYFYKSLKWLARIELLAEDRPGYWERESAYHNEADPWREQRFDETQVTGADEIARFRTADDYTPWRGRVLLKARLGGWQPVSRDLAGLQLKFCSLRNARLQAADLREANFSLSNLEGADLRRVDARGADLEGASLAGADLREADFSGTALSATRFFRDFSNGKRLAAQVEGLRLHGARGLLEDQAAFLRARGAVGL